MRWTIRYEILVKYSDVLCRGWKMLLNENNDNDNNSELLKKAICSDQEAG